MVDLKYDFAWHLCPKMPKDKVTIWMRPDGVYECPVCKINLTQDELDRMCRFLMNKSKR